MSPIRVGVIGLSTRGWAATGLIPPLLEPLLKDKYTITAIATRSAASAKATAAKYSELTGHTVKGYYGEGGATQIANDPDVDLVVVSVKVTDHWKAAKPAIDAGKDIFLEWSPGKSLEENIALAEAAKAKGVRSIIGVQSGQSVTIRNVDQLIKAGKVGRILSVSASLVMPNVTGMGAKTAIEQVEFALDADNGTTLLTMLVGHFLTDLIHLVGQFKEVSATTTILFPDVEIVDTAGKPVGRTVRKTAPDQLVLTGTLGGANDGAIVTIHAQSGPATARHLWFIDGEEGTIEVRNKPENGPFGVFLAAHEMKLSWNDVEVEAPPQTDEDGLGNVTKAWLEFAKGKEGKYATLDDAVAAWRVIDAAQKSIAAGGKKVPVV